MTSTNPKVRFIVDYLKSKNPALTDVDPDLDLIENRVLDSLGFVNFLFVLEEQAGAEIALEDVVPDDFRTVRTIARRFFDITDLEATDMAMAEQEAS
jgi:acyl carrier protein